MAWTEHPLVRYGLPVLAVGWTIGGAILAGASWDTYPTTARFVAFATVGMLVVTGLLLYLLWDDGSSRGPDP